MRTLLLVARTFCCSNLLLLGTFSFYAWWFLVVLTLSLLPRLLPPLLSTHQASMHVCASAASRRWSCHWKSWNWCCRHWSTMEDSKRWGWQRMKECEIGMRGGIVTVCRDGGEISWYGTISFRWHDMVKSRYRGSAWREGGRREEEFWWHNMTFFFSNHLMLRGCYYSPETEIG